MPQHLSNLRIFNFAMAGIYALATLLCIALAIVMGVVGWPAMRVALQQDPGAPPPELIGGLLLAAVVLAAVLLLVECVLFVVVGRALPRGRGRVLQTVLAVLTITSVPVGTAYAIYALWVCWSHPPTKAMFDQTALAAAP